MIGNSNHHIFINHFDIIVVFLIHSILHIEIFHFNIYYRFLIYFYIAIQDFLLMRDVYKLSVVCNIFFS